MEINWVFATNSNYLILIFLQPGGNLGYFKLGLFDVVEASSCKDMEIKNRFYGKDSILLNALEMNINLDIVKNSRMVWFASNTTLNNIL